MSVIAGGVEDVSQNVVRLFEYGGAVITRERPTFFIPPLPQLLGGNFVLYFLLLIGSALATLISFPTKGIPAGPASFLWGAGYSRGTICPARAQLSSDFKHHPHGASGLDYSSESSSVCTHVFKPCRYRCTVSFYICWRWGVSGMIFLYFSLSARIQFTSLYERSLTTSCWEVYVSTCDKAIVSPVPRVQRLSPSPRPSISTAHPSPFRFSCAPRCAAARWYQSSLRP